MMIMKQLFSALLVRCGGSILKQVLRITEYVRAGFEWILIRRIVGRLLIRRVSARACMYVQRDYLTL